MLLTSTTTTTTTTTNTFTTTTTTTTTTTNLVARLKFVVMSSETDTDQCFSMMRTKTENLVEKSFLGFRIPSFISYTTETPQSIDIVTIDF